MNKSELVAAVAAQAGLTKAQAQKAVEATVDAIAGALKNGDKVQLVGFGTFSVTEKAAREGVNPATGAKIQIPAKKVAKFKAGAGLAL
jgi:DNA-binding protein HU-beta